MMRKVTNEKDLRIQKTKRAIKENLKKMICELPFEKITVKELAKRAEINRNTFYLHYDIIDDVLIELQSEYISKYLELVKDYNFIDHQPELIKNFFEFTEKQDEIFIKITCDERYDYIRNAMQDKVMQKAIEKTAKEHGLNKHIVGVISTFNSCALYLYRQWVKDGRKIPLKKMIEITSSLMENGVKGVREKYSNP